MERRHLEKTRNINLVMRISNRERKSKLPGRAEIFSQLEIVT
jgi:hypothetical protein